MTRLDDFTTTRSSQPSTHAAPQAASPPSRPDFDARITALAGLVRRHWRYILLFGIALADVVLAVPAFDGVLRSAQALSVFCAIAFSLLTVFAAFASGQSARVGSVGM